MLNIFWVLFLSKFLTRRTEELIKEKLNKKSSLLFDLSNPIFFDKNVLQENYLNLRRHLDTNSDINSEGRKHISQFLDQMKNTTMDKIVAV